jgi:hypothetical protein
MKRLHANPSIDLALAKWIKALGRRKLRAGDAVDEVALHKAVWPDMRVEEWLDINRQELGEVAELLVQCGALKPAERGWVLQDTRPLIDERTTP